jgi:hypothetical protein
MPRVEVILAIAAAGTFILAFIVSVIEKDIISDEHWYGFLSEHHELHN